MRFKVYGMTCSACSAHVEKSVRAVTGVQDVSVSLLTNSMRVDFDEQTVRVEDILAAVASGGYRAEPEGAQNKSSSAPIAGQDDERKQMLTRLIASVCLLIPLMYVGMGHMLGLPVPAVLHNTMLNGLVQLFLTLPVLYLNRSFFINGFKALWHRAPNMNSLIAVGSGAGLIYSLWQLLYTAYLMGEGQAVGMSEYYFESAAMILTLITLGKYLEARAKGRTSEAISKLVDLAPKRAIVVRDGAETEIDALDLKVGDIVVVYEGATVPTDGVIVEGHGSVDQSMLTGESAPVDLFEGNEVVGATVNRAGYFKFRAAKVGEDTALSKIVHLVEEAANSKAPISRLADKVSGIFVPIVLTIGLITAVSWLALGESFAFALKMTISVLVISCPCALGLATPTAIMVGTGKGAELGIMIKTAAALEMAHAIDVAAFDKTGTLTEGKMRVTSAFAANGSEEELKRSAGSVEARSSHPIAAAIVAYAGNTVDVDEYETLAGRGVQAQLDGKLIRVGSGDWMRECSISIALMDAWSAERRSQGQTVMFAARDNELLGAFALADGIKPRGAEAIKAMHALGVKTVMLTGDNPDTARAIAANAGVDDVRASLLPADKANAIAELRQGGKRVMMVGDGINDAPALAGADLGVAIGQGTDVAIESADIVLVRDDPALAAGAIQLGRAVIRNIRQNLFWAFFYNIIGIPIAAGVFRNAFGLELNPMFASAAMSLSSLCVVTNALRLRRFKLNLPEQECDETCPVPQVKIPSEKILKEENNMKKTIYVEGMMCQNCVKHVTRALEGLGGKVEVNLDEKRAVLTSSAEITDDAIRAAIVDAGYEVTGIE